jgi:hypothetical protein
VFSIRPVDVPASLLQVMFKNSQLPPGTKLRHVGDVMDTLLG